MISLKSFGFPYMAPLAPLRVSELKDALVRGPRWQMMTAPQFRKPQEAPPPTMLKQPYLQGENGEDQGQGGEEK
jgi:spore germination protein KA